MRFLRYAIIIKLTIVRFLYRTTKQKLMKLKKILLAAAAALMLASCSSSKTILPYFTDIQTVTAGDLPSLISLPIIQPNDELMINISTVNPAASANYAVPFVNPALNDAITRTTSPRVLTFTVDSEGNIDFPLLGRIHVAGMNVEQLREYLIKEVSKDVKDPIVTVQMVNFNVTVAGEVKSPAQIPVTAGRRITLLEALASAGDLTEYGERSNVLVIREENGERTFTHIDLNSADVLSSPYYYLQPNDYVYVSPNKIRQANSKYNQNNAFKLSVVSTIVSAASVIASLVIALTVK